MPTFAMDRTSLAKLSSCLGEASELVNNILKKDNTTSEESRSGTSASRSQQMDISAVLQRTRSMLNYSSTSGLTTQRLNKRERLRATSQTSGQQAQKKKAKKEDLKAFEFVLVSIDDEDEQESGDWVITDDIIILRGLIELATDSSEATIRRKICDVIRVNYPIVADSDIVFLKANRRKLSVLMNCGSFGYKQLKVAAGQGAIYIKLTAGFDCLLQEKKSPDNDDDDGK